MGPWITLSVGDGANDVPMITEAHIGIGIRGKEGTQAIRSADYAVSQFMYLLRMILVHGRWGYRRISWLVLYYFYKNIILAFTELGFAYENGFSGQIYFPDLLPTMYNAVWTSWQCLFAYTIEQDVNDHFVFRYPVVFKAGQLEAYFNIKIFWRWIIFSIWHGVVTYYGCTYGLSGPIDFEGKTYSHWFISMTAFTCVIHIIMLKLFLETVYWNWISTGTGIFCLSFYYFCLFFLNYPTLSIIVQPQITGDVMLIF